MSVLLGLRRLLGWGLLLVVWWLIFTPFAMVSWAVRGDVLQRTVLPDADSYWAPRSDAPEDEVWSFFISSGKIWMVPLLVLILALGVLLVASESSLVLAFLYPLF